MSRTWIDLFKSRYPAPPTPTMSPEQALQTARQRWPHGSILRGDRSKGEASCLVGYIDPMRSSSKEPVVRSGAFVVRGIGLSWEEAFLDADCRDKQELREKAGRRRKRKGILDHIQSL